MHKTVRDYALILLGSFLYMLGTCLFIFPHGLLLGGTSGISVILARFLPFSPAAILSGFYVDASSGGTDIIALIIRKYSSIRIGRALLITDVVIVLLGGIPTGLASFTGLFIKTLGIDGVMALIRRMKDKKKEGRA